MHASLLRVPFTPHSFPQGSLGDAPVILVSSTWFTP